MKYCEKCGNKLTDTAKFCNKCGTKQTVDETVQNVNTEQKVAQPENVIHNSFSVEFPQPLKPKKKIGKIAILISSIALVLVAVIVAGVIIVPSFFSSGVPKTIQIDEDTAVFDMTFEQFRKQYNDLIEPVGNTFDLSNSDYSISDYKEAFNNEDNWCSWNEDNKIYHKWTYDYSESFGYEILVSSDNDTNRILAITTKSYYPDITTKIILTYLMVYGNKNIEENAESALNLIKLFLGDANYKTWIFDIDDLVMFSLEEEEYSPTFFYIPEAENTLDDFGTVISLPREDLAHFDKILSSRYNYDYEWEIFPSN